MIACPNCASTDLVAVEIDEDDAETLYECESCGDQFRGGEVE